jgi:hypothetical protein
MPRMSAQGGPGRPRAKLLGLLTETHRSFTDFLQFSLYRRNCLFVFAEGNEIHPRDESLNLFDAGEDVPKWG